MHDDASPVLTIYGTVISTYSRIVQITAEEAGISWRHIATPANGPENRERHPFRKVPTVEIDGLEIFETVAICQYIDNVYNAAALQPQNPTDRAAMDQWIAAANAYIFPQSEHGLIMPHMAATYLKTPLRSDIIERELPEIARHLGLLSDRIEAAGNFAGRAFSLADIYCYCIVRAIQLTSEGGNLIHQLLPLRHWLLKTAKRPSIAATLWPSEQD